MKSLITVICMAAISGPCTAYANGRTSNGPTANNSGGGTTIHDQAPGAKRAHPKAHANQTTRQPQSNLSSLKGAVASEMRATKAFVKENVVKSGGTDHGLMLLAATGLIILQLRRKHKLLPQRPIAPYA